MLIENKSGSKIWVVIRKEQLTKCTSGIASGEELAQFAAPDGFIVDKPEALLNVLVVQRCVSAQLQEIYGHNPIQKGFLI